LVSTDIENIDFCFDELIYDRFVVRLFRCVAIEYDFGDTAFIELAFCEFCQAQAIGLAVM